MKNLKTLCMLMLGLVLTFSSCEENEEFGQEENAPELSFTKKDGKLVVDLDDITTVNSIQWFVNGQLLEDEELQNLDLSSYDLGTYKICIVVVTPNYPNGIEFCENIDVDNDDTDNDNANDEDCPNLQYTRDGDYLFADFEGIQDLEFYAWEITGETLNEPIYEDEGTNNQGDNKFSLKELEPGSYTICLISESATCVQAERFCKEIKIEGAPVDTCPQLSFKVEGGLLLANFPEMDQLTYEWFVNDQFIEVEGLNSQERDDILDLSSYNPGTYTVCIKAETNECPKGTEFCKEVVIPEPQQVDCSVFDIIYFTTSNAEFVGAKVLSIDVDKSTVVWTIDGAEVTPASPTKNIVVLQDHITQLGKYEVCYKAESTSCGTLEKCIEVDFQGI